MLYEFRSPATGTVTMTADVAEPILHVLGKNVKGPGIVTVEQLPEAIGVLERAVAQARIDEAARRDEHPGFSIHNLGATSGGAFGSVRSVDAPPGSMGTPAPTQLAQQEHREEPVSFGQRAWPLLDMMRAALAAKREVTWSV